MRPGAVVLRPATLADADDIARIMRAALQAFDWIPQLHTPEEDRGFIRGHVLPNQSATVAESAGAIVGFIAIYGCWVTQLYLDPQWTGRGIGAELLRQATRPMDVVKLYCFQSNAGARRFYEREGFDAAGLGDGSGNEEGLPDIFTRGTDPCAARRKTGLR